MTLHRAVLKTRDYVAEDGTVVPMIKDDVPIGTEYVVDASVRLPRTRCFNVEVMREFALELVYARRQGDSDAEYGALPACVFDVDEAPMEAAQARTVYN